MSELELRPPRHIGEFSGRFVRPCGLAMRGHGMPCPYEDGAVLRRVVGNCGGLS